MEARTSWRLGYRPALDGLRGIAVALVVISHAKVPGFVFAGQAGVTLFFVLSGFLITTLLVEERRTTGRIGLRAFYARRVARLLPALVLVVVVSAFLDPLGALERSVAVLAYVGNWLHLVGLKMHALGHTWSLSIEEQFYLLWPLVLGAALNIRLSPRLIAVGLAILATLAIAARQLARPDFVYIQVATQTRADAILIGCVLAVLLTAGYRVPRTRAIALLAAVLFAVIALGSDESVKWIVGLTLLSIAGGLLVNQALGSSPLLEWRPLRWLGRISYGVYLWNWVVVYSAGTSLAGLNPLLRLLIDAVVTISLAAVSYYGVEQPVMRWHARRRREALRSAFNPQSTDPAVTYGER